MRCINTVSKIADVASLQVSLAVVSIATEFGFERHGDHAVNVVGCDVDSAESEILFNIVLSAVYAPAFEGFIGTLKDSVIKHTSRGCLVLGTVWIACCRWSQVLQHDDIAVFSECIVSESEFLRTTGLEGLVQYGVSERRGG